LTLPLNRTVIAHLRVMRTARFQPRADDIETHIEAPATTGPADARLRTAIFSAALFVIGGVAWLPTMHLGAFGVPGPRLPWWTLAPGFAVAEVFVLHVQVRREARTISLSDLPFVLGLFFATPTTLLTARLLGGVAIYVFWRRQPLLKVAFNTAQLVIELSTALLIFRLLAGRPDSGCGRRLPRWSRWPAPAPLPRCW